MKRFLTILLILAMTLIAQAGLKPSARRLVRESRHIRTMSAVNVCSPKIDVIVKLTKGADMTQLSRWVDEVKVDLGDMAVVSVAVDRLEALGSLPMVEGVDVGLPKALYLDFAHQTSNTLPCYEVDVDGQPTKFDGSGVVCGFFDIGLDAHHVNFLDQQGKTRFSHIWFFPTDDENDVELYDSSNMDRFVTDDSTETHATHVAGIIGGKCYRPGISGIASTNDRNGDFTVSGHVEGMVPYHGVATGAEMVGAMGELTDANIITGVSKIIDYARSEGKPCVVNLSLGTTGGPHDGTDYFTAALSRMGRDAIICVASGNDGNRNMSIVKTLGEGEQLKTLTSNRRLSSYLDIWSDSDEPLQVSWWILDRSSGQTWAVTEPLGLDEELLIEADECEALKGYQGQLYVCAYVDESNNRFNFFSQGIGLKPLADNTSQWLYVKVEGRAGTRVYMYGGSNVTLVSGGMAGFTDGTPDYSISSNACADNILSVGSYVSRNLWPFCDGTYGFYSGYATIQKVGDLSIFSSYGKGFDGRQYPHVCAPGANIVSSYSRCYVERVGGGVDNYTSVCAYVDGKEAGDRYVWNVMQGTSMSCPYVAGAVALWLQADPTLGFDEVLDVISKTSVASTSNAERWGAGMLDTHAGLQYVLANRSDIGCVMEDDVERLMVKDCGGYYEVYVDGADRGFAATLYDMQGRRVVMAQSDGCKTTLASTMLKPGIYLLNVMGDNFSINSKLCKSER